MSLEKKTTNINIILSAQRINTNMQTFYGCFTYAIFGVHRNNFLSELLLLKRPLTVCYFSYKSIYVCVYVFAYCFIYISYTFIFGFRFIYSSFFFIFAAPQVSCSIRNATNKRRSIPIIVRVSDVNDNAPRFMNTPYEVTVPEVSRRKNHTKINANITKLKKKIADRILQTKKMQIRRRCAEKKCKKIVE